MNPDGIIALIGTIRERVYRVLRSELETHGMQGLAPSHGAILSQLFRGQELAMSEIATRIDRDRSTVTTLIEKLAEHGYVERRKDEKDGRIMYVSLTKRGQALETAFDAISKLVLTRTYEGFSQEERKELASLLERVAKNWEE